jgi:integrase
MFQTMRQGLPIPHLRVFTYAGRSVESIKRAFATAVRKASIDDFTFHDLRHTAINNWRLQGHDYFRIMSASGHKTMHVFKRYNTVSKEELKTLVGEKT